MGMGSFGGGVGSFGSAGQGALGAVAGGRISTAYIELIVNNAKAIAQMRAMRGETEATAAAMDRSLSGAAMKARTSWATSFSSMGTDLQNRGRAMVSSGAVLSRRLSLPLIAVGAVATKMALDFDTALKQIQALGGATGLSIDDLRTKVLELAKTTAQSPLDLAHSLYFVSSAGLKASEVLPVLTAAAKGAATGMGDAATLGQLLVSVLNGYRGTGLSAANVMNVLAEAIRKGNVEPAQFAKGLGLVIPIASQLGVSLDQVAAAVSNATNYGTEATRAFTGMRYLLSSLARPTAMAKSALGQYGFTIGWVQKSIADPNRGLLWTLRTISDRMNLQSVAGRQAWGSFIGGVRGAVIANTIVGRSLERTNIIFDSLHKAMDDTSTSFQRAYDVMRARPQFAFQQAMTTLRETMIQLGTVLVPVLVHDILPAITFLMEKFSGASSATQEWIVRLGILAALLGPGKMLIGGLTWLVGGLFKGVGAILRFIGVMAPAQTETQVLTGATDRLTAAMQLNVDAATEMAAAQARIAEAAGIATGAVTTEAGAIEGLAGAEATAGGMGGLAGVQVARGAAGLGPLMGQSTPIVAAESGAFGAGQMSLFPARFAAPASGAATELGVGQMALPFAEGGAVAQVTRGVEKGVETSVVKGVETQVSKGALASLGTTVADSLTGFVEVAGPIIAAVGTVAVAKSAIDAWHGETKEAARQAAGGLTVMQQKAITDQAGGMNLAGFNLFRSGQNLVDEANKRYLTVLDEARKAHLNFALVIPKLTAGFATAVHQIGGLNGSMPKFQQQLEALIGLASSPAAQDFANFAQGLSVLPAGPAPSTTLGAWRAQQGRAPAAPPPFGGFAPPPLPPPPLSQGFITAALGKPAAIGGPYGQTKLSDQQKQLQDYMNNVNKAVEHGASLREVVNQTTADVKRGILPWETYVGILGQLHQALPLRAAGQFADTLIRSSGVTMKQAQAFTRLLQPLHQLGISIPPLNASLINEAIASGNMKVANELLAGSLRGPIVAALKTYRGDLSKTELAHIQEALAAGNYMKALALLNAATADAVKKQHAHTDAVKAAKRAQDALDASMHGSAANIAKNTDAFFLLGREIDKTSKFNVAEKNTLREVIGKMQESGHELSKQEAAHLASAIAAGHFATAIAILTGNLNKVPKSTKPKVSLDDKATPALKGVNAKLNSLDRKRVSATVDVNIVPHGPRVIMLPGPGGTVHPVYLYHTGGEVLRFGGMHHGFKGLRSDEVPAILQQGEVVIQRKVVRRPGMLQRLLNINEGKDEPKRRHRGGFIDRVREHIINRERIIDRRDEVHRVDLVRGRDGARGRDGTRGAEAGARVRDRVRERESIPRTGSSPSLSFARAPRRREPKRFHLGGPVPFPQTDPIWDWDWPQVRRYMAGFGEGPIRVYVPPGAPYVAPRLPEPRGRALSPGVTEQFSYRPQGPMASWSNAEWGRYMGAGPLSPAYPDERTRLREQRSTTQALRHSPAQAMQRWNRAAGLTVFAPTTDPAQADVTVWMHPAQVGPSVTLNGSTFRAAGLGAPTAHGPGIASRGTANIYGFPDASVITHELGHTIGLAHPPTLGNRNYSDRRLIMSGSGGPIAPSEGTRVRDLFLAAHRRHMALPVPTPSQAAARGAKEHRYDWGGLVRHIGRVRPERHIVDPETTQHLHRGGTVRPVKTSPLPGWSWKNVKRYIAGFGQGPIAVYFANPKPYRYSPLTATEHRYGSRAEDVNQANYFLHRGPSKALAAWNRAIGQTVFRITNDKGAADIRVDMTPNQMPKGPNVGGIGWPGRDAKTKMSLGHVQTYGEWAGFPALLEHELGHAIGLGHPLSQLALSRAAATGRAFDYLDPREVMSSGTRPSRAEGARVRSLLPPSSVEPHGNMNMGWLQHPYAAVWRPPVVPPGTPRAPLSMPTTRHRVELAAQQARAAREHLYDSGGLVRRAGMVKRDEYVINPKMSQRYRGLLDAVNAGKVSYGGGDGAGVGAISEAITRGLSGVQLGAGSQRPGTPPTIIVNVLIDGEEVRGKMRKRELMRGTAG